MDINYVEWLNMLARWIHLIVGIAWIGSSFYFVFTDASLRPNASLNKKAHGDTWQVHGGGFYHIQKYLVAPDKMPDELHWFKYEAYFTWISGAFLMAVIYYLGAEAFLIDPEVMELTPMQGIFVSLVMLAGGWVAYDAICRSPLGNNTAVLAVCVFALILFASWAFSGLFSGRAAFLHTGALVGSMMVGNVFFVIIPNQKKVVKALTAGETPAAYLGAQAKQRSLHNNYLTLPVLLMMISNHYPMTYGHEYSWVIFGGILLIGGTVRHYFNLTNSGIKSPVIPWLLPTAAAMTIAVMMFTSYKPGLTGGAIASNGVAVDPKAAFQVVKARCTSCHSSLTTDEDWDEAPGGTMFDTLEQVRAHSDKIKAQSVDTTSMPLGNKTKMTKEERELLGAWLAAGAPGLE